MENKREIKFRAWHMNLLEMEHDVQVLDRFSEILARPETYILMQFTGLHDKEGVEIYDQDICKSVHFKDGKKTHYLYHKIVWCNKMLCWKAVSVQNGEDESTLTNGNSQLWVYIKNAGEFEVVGSTFTHPHLLEPKKEEKQ